MAALLASCATTQVASPPPPPVSEFEALTERGRYLADADRAAAFATDLFLAEQPDTSQVETYVVFRRGADWYVVFGKLSKDRETFTTRYAFTASSDHPDQPRAIAPTDAPRDIAPLARATKSAVDAVVAETQRRGLNPVVRQEGDDIIVWILQGTTTPKLVLFGGDYRFRFGPNGKQELDRVRLHNSVIPFDLRECAERQCTGGFHTHLVTELPTETDIATVLLHPEVAPHFVGGKTSLHAIEKDGTLRLVQREPEAE